MRRNTKIINLHRKIGILICAFLVLLSVTGIFLNHSDDLSLNKHYLNWPWLLKHYGLKAPEPKQNFNLGSNSVTNVDGQIFYNEVKLFQTSDEIKGAILKNNYLYIALSDEIMIFDDAIEIVMSLVNMPATVELIGTNPDDEQIRFLDSNYQSWTYNAADSEWIPDSTKIHDWSQLEPMSSSQRQRMQDYFLSKGVTLEQFLLDLHNGAIFKKIGKYLLDAIGVLTFLLSITGILMWGIRKR